MKNKKAFGFYASCVTAILLIVTLVVMLVYKGRGGIVANTALAAVIGAIVCELASFGGEKPWTDFTSVIGAALAAYVLMKVAGDGIWNIAESINGIKMVGLPELAGMNYLMAGLGVASIITGIAASFAKKSK